MKKNIVCRKCRRAGVKLFLKGEKCLSPKCPFAKRSYAPGQHGAMRRRISEYGNQLREKQKAKQIFFLSEEKFRKIYEKASKAKGNVGEELLRNLEMRFDNIVFRLGLAASRRQARQFISHGQLLLNGKKVDVPSMTLKVGDEISFKPKAKNLISLRKTQLGKIAVPEWLELDVENIKGKVVALPTREQMESSINESAIIELYSR